MDFKRMIFISRYFASDDENVLSDNYSYEKIELSDYGLFGKVIKKMAIFS